MLSFFSLFLCKRVVEKLRIVRFSFIVALAGPAHRSPKACRPGRAAQRGAALLAFLVGLLLVGLGALGCSEKEGAPALSKERRAPARLSAGQALPARSEVDVAGAIRGPILRSQARFKYLVASHHPAIVFKDEERSGADRLMSKRLRTRLHRLAERVKKEWPGVRLRVTEAWDEDLEHGAKSLHYEGRAADLTTSDRDADKLGRLAGLAVATGFDWVYFENASHVHVSVRK